MGLEIAFPHAGCRFCLVVSGVSSQNTCQPLVGTRQPRVIGGVFKHIWVDFHFGDISLILK